VIAHHSEEGVVEPCRLLPHLTPEVLNPLQPQKTQCSEIQEADLERAMTGMKRFQDLGITWLCTDEPVKKGFITSGRASS
jgi:hypothetical protein